ncbi:MAG: Spy/CpxP family protein refolding chaperone [Thermoanaerobaculia bacterium]
MIGRTMTAIAAVALAGTVALAGGPGRGGHHGNQGGQDRMKRMAEQLQLSDAQIDAMKQMRQADRQRNKAHRDEAQAIAKQWVALKDKGDTKGAEKLHQQLTTMREEMRIRRLAESGKFKEVLTPEQQEKLEQLKAERPMRGEGRGGRNAPPPPEK